MQGCDHLRCVQIMSGGDDNRVDGGVVENLPLIRGTGTKSKSLGRVPRMSATRSGSHDHFEGAAPFDRRQQGARGEAPRAKQADSNGFRTREWPVAAFD